MSAGSDVAGHAARATIAVGTKLPELSLYGDPTFIVSTAIATRDYQDVHHDRDKAQAKGSNDIFVNILTDTGLAQRYITDWAGPTAAIKSISLRLAAEEVLDALEDAGLTPADVDGMVTFTMDFNTEVAVVRATGIGELKFFSKVHHGGRAACAHHPAGGDRGRDRCRGLRCRISGFQRTLGNADRPGADPAGGERRLDRRGQLLLVSARPVHAGGAGGDDRQTLHAPVRGDEPRLRRGFGGRPQARGQEPEGLLLPEADHH
jgi:hypothetical protein